MPTPGAGGRAVGAGIAPRTFELNTGRTPVLSAAGGTCGA